MTALIHMQAHAREGGIVELTYEGGQKTVRFSHAEAAAIANAHLGLIRKAALFNAMVPVVAAAVRCSDCAAEFDGDLAVCQEYIDRLWMEVDRYRALLATLPPAEESGTELYAFGLDGLPAP